VKSFLRGLTPPIVLDAYRALMSRSVRYEGPYASWQEAGRHAGGYDQAQIFEAVRSAALKVKKGEAAFERDSVAFAKMRLPFPLLAALLRAAARNGGALNVLDFGGSLGSTYFRCRDFLAPVASLRWSVVEQPKLVECGRREFAGESLQFHASLAECLAQEKPNVALLSSSLPYVEDPYGVLGQISAGGVADIIVDRTSYHDGAEDLIFVQQVPPQVYEASYPCRVFGSAKLAGALDANYRMVAALDSEEGSVKAGATLIRYGGWAWSRRQSR